MVVTEAFDRDIGDYLVISHSAVISHNQHLAPTLGELVFIEENYCKVD